MRYLTIFSGILISWSIICAPVIHADNITQSFNHSQKTNCDIRDASQVDRCFINGTNKNIDISSDAVRPSGKAKIANSFKSPPLFVNFNLGLHSKKDHKPPPTYTTFAPLIVKNTVKLE